MAKWRRIVISARSWRAYPGLVRGDGDGWMVSESGTHHWGRFGAAGLLVRAPRLDGDPAVLLQHRAPWSHQGGTWGLPGGALDSHEAPEDAALREAEEEAGLPREHLQIRAQVKTAEVFGPGGTYWRYTTVVADAPGLLDTVPNQESSELRWVAENQVADLPLHPGFAASWGRLRIGAAVPPHSCGLRRPHTLETTEAGFAWCRAGAPRCTR